MIKKLTKKDATAIKDLRSKFSLSIDVCVSRSEDGGFVARILSFPGCLTQGETLSELVEMVNDCVKTYLDIPAQYYSFMPTYLPPVGVAHDLDVFPAPRGDRKLKMLLAHRERVHD